MSNREFHKLKIEFKAALDKVESVHSKLTFVQSRELQTVCAECVPQVFPDVNINAFVEYVRLQRILGNGTEQDYRARN